MLAVVVLVMVSKPQAYLEAQVSKIHILPNINLQKLLS